MPPPNEVLSGVSACETAAWIMYFSYTLSREYRVLRNRYSWLLFTSENRFYVNLRLQEQSANMTPQYTTFASRHRSTVVGDVTRLSQKRPPLVTMAKSAIDFVFSMIVCSRQSSVQEIKWYRTYREWRFFGHSRSSSLHHLWTLSANSLTRVPEIAIQGNSCIIRYSYIIIY